MIVNRRERCRHPRSKRTYQVDLSGAENTVQLCGVCGKRLGEIAPVMRAWASARE